jgi:hypothetical protein
MLDNWSWEGGKEFRLVKRGSFISFIVASANQLETQLNLPRQTQEYCNLTLLIGNHGRALSSTGIRSNKKTYTNYRSSAGMADIVCANENQIRRQGRWNNATISGAYFTSLPREIMQPMAGFPANGRSFYLARAVLDPPTSLCKKLFPAIDERHNRLAAKELSLTTTILFNLPLLSMHLNRWSWCSGKLLYKTLCSWWNSTPVIPFGNIESFLIQPTCHSKGNSAP